MTKIFKMFDKKDIVDRVTIAFISNFHSFFIITLKKS